MINICNYYKIISDKLEVLLKEYIQTSTINKEILSEIDNLIYFLKINNLPNPCMKCSSCYDFGYYMTLFTELANNRINYDELQEKIQSWDKVKHYDKSFDFLEKYESSISLSNKDIFVNNKEKIIVYFDHNIFIDYVDDEILKDKINTHKSTVLYCFSPSHINEILKLKNESRRRLFFDNLMSLTEGLGIYIVNNKLECVKTDLSYIDSMHKYLMQSIELAEQYRVIQIKDREIYFKKYTNKDHLRQINNYNIADLDNSVFNRLLEHVKCNYTIDEIKCSKFEAVPQLNHVIHSLYNTLNLISYHIDKKERTIISSAHDIEHIKYATKSHIFVTDDKKLRMRISQIYKLLNISVEIMNKDQYISYLVDNT